MAKPLKVGLVGLTGRGRGYGGLLTVDPRTEIRSLCDTESENLAGAAEHFDLPDAQCFEDYESFLESDIDIVVIGTPMPMHAEQCTKALALDKHVLCEVTAGTSVQECEQVFDAVKRSKGLYMLAENCCYFHFVQQCSTIIHDGAIGNIFYAEAEYVHEIQDRVIDPDTGKPCWRANRPPLHYCSHSLGPILMFLDDHIVKATGAGTARDIIEDVGPGAINMQVGLFETSQGTIIKLLRSSLAPGPYHLFYSVYGTKGFLETPRHSQSDKGMRFSQGGELETMDCLLSDPDAPEGATKGGHGTSEHYLARDFLDAIEGHTEPPIAVTQAMDMSLPGIVAHEAAMKGSVWLDVPHLA